MHLDDGVGGAVRSMPPAVTELGRPWASLVGSIPNLTDDLEREFRFGHKVGPFGEGYRLGGSLKGGSSAIWAPATVDQFHAYEEWHGLEGLAKIDDLDAYGELAELLGGHGVDLTQAGYGDTPLEGGHAAGRGDIYRLSLEVLGALPPEHLSRPEFVVLHLGGWGPDSAKASAYDEGTVHMYQFAMTGARRTFLGLLLHELGHCHDEAMPPSSRALVTSAHSQIASEYALIGVEFLLDAESRKVYQQFLADEFIAETYLVYTSQGGRLRDFISGLEGPLVQEAWAEVYDIFRETFEGVEYA